MRARHAQLMKEVAWFEGQIELTAKRVKETEARQAAEKAAAAERNAAIQSWRAGVNHGGEGGDDTSRREGTESESET